MLGVIGAVLVITAQRLEIPPAFSEIVGVNARLQFLKQASPSAEPGLIMGASVASNNVNTDIMESAERRPFVNAGAYGFNVGDQARMYRLVREKREPREVIFVSQYYEYGRERLALTASDEVLARYLSGRMSILEEASYYQLPVLWAYASNWGQLRGRTHASSVAFNRTGSIPLAMDVRRSDPRHLTASVLGTRACNGCMAPVEELCRTVIRDGQRFTAVISPVQVRAIAGLPRHRAMRSEIRARMRKAVAACGGDLIDAADFPEFDDGCFADYSHLNTAGMAIFTQMLLAHRAGRRTYPEGKIQCD